jgi:DNA polymerase-3 subunit alpha
VPDWDERDHLAKEKEVLGFYLSKHPLEEHEDKLSTHRTHTTTEAARLPGSSDVMVGGMLAALKHSHTKNPRPGQPSRYVMFDLEDRDGLLRCILWPDGFQEFGELVEPDAIVMIQGRIEKRPGSEEATLIVNEVIPLDALDRRYTRGIVVRVSEDKHGEDGLARLHEILRGYPGQCSLELLLCLEDGTRVPCRCDEMRVEVNPEMRRRVDDLLGPGNVRLVTATPKTQTATRGNGNGRGRRPR